MESQIKYTNFRGWRDEVLLLNDLIRELRKGGALCSLLIDEHLFIVDSDGSPRGGCCGHRGQGALCNAHLINNHSTR